VEVEQVGALVARWVHGIGASLWLGSIFFSAIALHKRAPHLFERDDDFEDFITGLTDGNRRLHLLAYSASLVSGLLLWWMMGARASAWVMVAKLVCWSVAASVFVYISWWLWPHRIFALRQERAWFRRRGDVARGVMFAALGLAAALGLGAVSMRT
jgi:hypothetical protein